MKQKKIPMRRCIGCYESKPKKELLRIVRDTEGKVTIDYTGRINGRGAYLCNNKECFEKMVKANKLSKEFETEIGNETYDGLKMQFMQRSEVDDSKSGGGAVGK